jgi:uncharacterized protein
MIVSPYSFFFKALIGNDYLAYNAFTNSLVEFSPEDYTRMQNLIRSPDVFSEKDNNGKVWNMLVGSGILVDEGFDFINVLKSRYKSSNNSKSLSLTIAPTLNCNFRCSYCFENSKSGVMSQEVQKKLLKFVEVKLLEEGNLNVTWFGGEPLLCLDIIESLSNGLIEICERKKAKYSNVSIITNGFLLDEKMAKKLKTMRINSVQVTLDGPEEFHDSRRTHINGKGTFRRIYENIKNTREILNIVVRVNLDKHNSKAIFKLQNLFDENGLQDVHIYPGHVQAYTDACKDLDSVCIPDEEFMKIKWEFEMHLIAKGRYTQGYPNLLYGFCIANNRNGYVISPSGLIFKCWNDICEDESICCGNLGGEESSEMGSNLDKWVNWDPFNNQECCECSIAPLCMGGCPYMQIKFKKSSCSRHKKYITDIVALNQALGRIYDVKNVLQKNK